MSKTKKPLFDSNPNPLISSHSMEIKARCVYHKSLELTNFCKDLNCLMPLCPECMKNHLEKHKIEQNYGDIDRIETVLEEALIVIEKLGNFYRSDLSNIDNLNRLKREAGKIIDDKISLAKKKIYSIIENFFTIFAKESKEIFLKQENCFFEELETSKKFLNYKMEEIEKFRKNLKDSKKFVKYIVKLNSTTFYSDNFNYHKEIEQYLDLLQNKLVQPVVDDSKLYSFNLELAKFIFLKNAEIYKENLDDLFTNPPKPNDNYRIKSSSDKKIMDISPKYKSFKEDLNNVLHSHNKKLTPKSPEKRLMDLSNFLYKGSPGEKQSYYCNFTVFIIKILLNLEKSSRKRRF